MLSRAAAHAKSGSDVWLIVVWRTMSRMPDIADTESGGTVTRAITHALAAAALLFCGCASPPSPETPPDFALSEREARQAGALALYAKGILLENTENGDTNANKRAALEAFHQAVILDPGNRRPVETLISNLEDEKRYADALTVLEGFLKLNPDDTGLRLEAARMAEILDRPAEAARHCEILIADKSAPHELVLALVRLYFQADKPGEAIRVMRDLHDRSPSEKNAALPVSWALFFTHEGKSPERSLACLELALPQRTSAAERAALMTLSAENHLQLGNTNTAENVLLQAHRTDPSANAAILSLGAIWAARPDATNLLARMARMEPDPHFYLLVLAATHQALGDPAAAAAALGDVYVRRLRESYFPGEDFYLWYATLLESTKQTEKAERILISALTAHPGSHMMQNFLAYMWAEQGKRLDEADRLINQALRVLPNNAAYLDTKGWVLFKQGRFHDALQFLLKAAEIGKRDHEIFDHTGDALKAIGRESEAIVFWQRSRELAPNPSIDEKLRQLGEP